MLEQKWLENHEIYYIGAAELPLEFTYGAPLFHPYLSTRLLCPRTMTVANMSTYKRKKPFINHRDLELNA